MHLTGRGSFAKKLQEIGFGSLLSNVSNHSPMICWRVCSLVDHVRYVALNTFSVLQFFSIANYLYRIRNIRESRKAANLDETGFTPGRDLIGCRGPRVISASHFRAGIPWPQFRYINRISLLFTLFGNRCSELPAAVFFRGTERQQCPMEFVWRRF